MKSILRCEGQAGLSHGARVPRREFLAGLAALGATALIPDARSGAQTRSTARAAPHRVDVHSHFSSPGFIDAIKVRNTGQRPLMEWTPAKALEDMDKDGVATSIVSTSLNQMAPIWPQMLPEGAFYI